MREIDEFDEEAGGTVFRDVVMLALAGFVVIVMLLLPHLNPPVQAAKEEVASPGNVVIEVRWPDVLDTDVDLWVQAPGDVPVGYSNRGGQVFNLLRDDRGHLHDATKLNYEVSYSRGIPAGEYTVNLHLYTTRTDLVSAVPATVVVSLKQDSGRAAKQILVREITLKRVGEEITVFRFKIDDQKRLATGSVHDLHRPLRERVHNG